MYSCLTSSGLFEIQGVPSFSPSSSITICAPTASLRATARRRSPGHLPSRWKEKRVTTFWAWWPLLDLFSLEFLLLVSRLFKFNHFSSHTLETSPVTGNRGLNFGECKWQIQHYDLATPKLKMTYHWSHGNFWDKKNIKKKQASIGFRCHNSFYLLVTF